MAGRVRSAAAQIAERFLSAAVVSTKDLLMMRLKAGGQRHQAIPLVVQRQTNLRVGLVHIVGSGDDLGE